ALKALDIVGDGRRGSAARPQRNVRLVNREPFRLPSVTRNAIVAKSWR
ncbi:MAG: hypothetical protein QOE52_1487, partial [Mycobacterium sp.]|nr:hypothetical protein [Mycobacterium sp.]